MIARDILQRGSGPPFTNRCRIITNASERGVIVTIFLGTTRRVEIDLSESDLSGLQEMAAQVRDNDLGDDDDVIDGMRELLTEGKEG